MFRLTVARGEPEGVADDDPLVPERGVEYAAAGRCRMIVSGDKHLLDISGYRRIQVLRPWAFVDLHL